MNIGKNGVEEIKFQGGREILDENSVPATTRKSPTRIFHKDELDTNHVRLNHAVHSIELSKTRKY
jgi:hypothetical protein